MNKEDYTETVLGAAFDVAHNQLKKKNISFPFCVITAIPQGDDKQEQLKFIVQHNTDTDLLRKILKELLQKMDPNRAVTIGRSQMGQRAINVLQMIGFAPGDPLQVLQGISYHELISVRNCGPKTVKEITDTLDKHNIQWKK